jgi:pyruvate/2-oxoglutarate dehydrogenase complex dihydrolipoamide dehydrogenase (E3) component
VLDLEADACILAIGQKADLSFLTEADGVALTPGGTIKIDPATLATSAPGIHAGGDVAFGPRNLIEAVANGKARPIDPRALPATTRSSRPVAIEKLPTLH